MEWLVEGGDPKIICHPVVVLFSDLIWFKIASWYFFAGKCWFLFTLLVFIIGQSVLAHLNQGNETAGEQMGMFACRLFIYLGSMGLMIRRLVTELFRCIKLKNCVLFGRVAMPAFLKDWRELTSLVLTITLIFMLTQEQIFWDAAHSAPRVAPRIAPSCEELCEEVSAYTLACGRVLSEVGLFLGALAFLIIAVSSAISCLNQNNKDCAGIPKGALSFVRDGSRNVPK